MLSSYFTTANMSPHARRGVALGTIPLQTGAVFDPAMRLWLRGGLDGSSADVLCEWHPDGANHLDGSIRAMRVHVPVDLDAGVHHSQRADGYAYDFWTEAFGRRLDLVHAPGSSFTHVEHPAVDTANTKVRLNIRAKPYRSASNPAAREIEFDLETGNLKDRAGIQQSPARIELDPSPMCGAQVEKRYGVVGRILPEHEGGTVAEPSFGIAVKYSVPHQDYDGRSVRFDIEVVNSLITRDDGVAGDAEVGAYRDDEVSFELIEEPFVEIEVPNAADDVVVESEKCFLAGPPERTGNVFKIRLTDIRNLASRHHLWPNATKVAFSGVIHYGSGTPTATEAATKQAVFYATDGTGTYPGHRANEETQGFQPFLDLVSTEWIQRPDAWGAFGTLPDSVEQGVYPNAVVARQTAALLCAQDFGAYVVTRGDQNLTARNRWRDPIHGIFAHARESATHAEFGSFYYEWVAETAWPDLRVCRLAGQHDGQRPLSWRYHDPSEVLDHTRHRVRQAGMETNVLIFNGMLYGVNKPYQDGMGKGIRLVGTGEPPRNVSSSSGGWVLDNQHWMSNVTCAARLLSPTPWLRLSQIQDYAAITAATKADPLDERLRRDGNDSLIGMQQPRSEGRVMQGAAHASVLVPGHPLLKRKLARRAIFLQEIANLPNTQAVYRQLVADLGAQRDLACPYFWSTRSFMGDNMDPLPSLGWEKDVLQPHVWMPNWLGIHGRGYTAAHRVLLDTPISDNPFVEQARADVVEMLGWLQKAIARYGFRKNSTTGNLPNPIYDIDWNHSGSRGSVPTDDQYLFGARNTVYENVLSIASVAVGAETTISIGNDQHRFSTSFGSQKSVTIAGVTGTLGAAINGVHVATASSEVESDGDIVGVPTDFTINVDTTGLTGSLTSATATMVRDFFYVYGPPHNPAGDGTNHEWMMQAWGGYGLADFYNPGDSDVEAAVQSLMRDTPIWLANGGYATLRGEAGKRGNRGWSRNGTMSYVATSNDPFTRWGDPPTRRPRPPALLKAAGLADRFSLSWSNPADNETLVRLQRSTDGETWGTDQELAANSTSYTDTAVVTGTDYYYRVRNENSIGNSAWSNVAFGTLAAGLPENPPAAPTALTISENAADLTIDWTDNSSDEDAFHIERRDADSAWAEIATTAANATSYVDNAVDAGVTYFYRVRAARTPSGDTLYSEYTNEVSGQLSVSDIPDAPSDVTAVASTSDVTISWTDNSDNETAFRIHRLAEGGDWTNVIATAPNATSYTDTGVTSGGAYSYRVRALGANGASRWVYAQPSLVVVAAATPAVPSAPAEFELSTDNSTVASPIVDLFWESNTPHANGFTIEYAKESPDTSPTWFSLATLASHERTYRDETLGFGVRRWYRLKATGSSGDSEWTDSILALVKSDVVTRSELLRGDVEAGQELIILNEDGAGPNSVRVLFYRLLEADSSSDRVELLARRNSDAAFVTVASTTATQKQIIAANEVNLQPGAVLKVRNPGDKVARYTVTMEVR